MTDKTKTYLVNIFEQGSQIGNKAHPDQVSRQMKLDKDVDVKLLFKPDEWRTPQQISQLFSRLAAAQKQVDEKDFAAEETELTLATLRNEVMEQELLPQRLLSARETYATLLIRSWAH